MIDRLINLIQEYMNTYDLDITEAMQKIKKDLIDAAHKMIGKGA